MGEGILWQRPLASTFSMIQILRWPQGTVSRSASQKSKGKAQGLSIAVMHDLRSGTIGGIRPGPEHIGSRESRREGRRRGLVLVGEHS